MCLRPMFKRSLRWQVGNGSKFSFWNDNWVYRVPLSCIILRPLGFANLCVLGFILDDGVWNRRLLEECLPNCIV